MQVVLLDDKDYIDNFQQQEELKENCIYLMENLNFRPDEHAYVETWVDPDDHKKEEPKVEEEEVKTGKDGKKIEEKKMSAADKKLAEKAAELKAKEEEVDEDTKRIQLEKEAEIAQAKEEAKQARMREEHFDAKTTFDYLDKLGKNFGQIYVNDAPLACLTTSNSVAEIKCDRKVMGLQMTSIVRKLAQFFLK